MIKKLWAKFSGLDVECVCNEHNRKCMDKDCKEYVVKFTEIKRSEIDEQLKKFKKDLDKDEQLIRKTVKELSKQTTELKKSINKFKI